MDTHTTVKTLLSSGISRRKIAEQLAIHRRVTNWIERLNRDYKRTLRMRGVMPDSDSVIFLLGKVSMTRSAYDRKVPKQDYEQKRFDWAEKDT